MNIFLKILVLWLFLTVNGHIVLSQTLFKDANESTTQRLFADPNKKTTDSSQAVYDEGGESNFNRLTETEKAIDFLKKEVANLKSELASLKVKVGDISQNRVNSENQLKTFPQNSISDETTRVTKPKSKPTPY